MRMDMISLLRISPPLPGERCPEGQGEGQAVSPLLLD
jgi:hypothetical protein